MNSSKTRSKEMLPSRLLSSPPRSPAAAATTNNPSPPAPPPTTARRANTSHPAPKSTAPSSPHPSISGNKFLGMGKGRRTGRKAGPAHFWRLAVLASVALNLAMLLLLLRPYNNHKPLLQCHSTPLLTHHSTACDHNNSTHLTTYKMTKAASTGKPPVTPDSLINLDHGDPTMYEAFWKEAGEHATVVIPGWQTMSYFSDVTNLCWFLEPEFDHQVRRLHRLVGNAAVDEGYYHVVVGTGSTQLFQAALFALSPPDAHEPMSVVSTAPYYSSYPAVTDFLRSGLYRWAGDATSFKGDTYIELVCSPNNPDGALHEAVLASEAGKTIHDLAYYWPQYTPITEQAGHGIMLFTVSKSTGHAGTRIGWALVKDRDIAQKMTKFIELNTIGVSKDSQLRAAKILRAVSDGYELPHADDTLRLFDFGRRLMVERWAMLRAAVAASGIFSLPEETSGFCNFTKERAATNPAFAWLRCEKEGIQDCASFLRSHKILTRSGTQFGADGTYVRVSMLDRDDAFEIFVKRLSSLS